MQSKLKQLNWTELKMVPNSVRLAHKRLNRRRRITDTMHGFLGPNKRILLSDYYTTLLSGPARGYTNSPLSGIFWSDTNILTQITMKTPKIQKTPCSLPTILARYQTPRIWDFIWYQKTGNKLHITV